MTGQPMLAGAVSLAAFLTATAVLPATDAFAGTVVAGTIYRTPRGATVDHIAFTVTTGATIDIDGLAYEGLGDDLNGDGEFAFFDPHIYLFTDDGSLDAADLIADNDDSLDTPPPVTGLDSHLSLFLAAGNYVLAIGPYQLDLGEAVAGLETSGDHPTLADFTSDPNGEYFEHDHGDYTVKFSEDVTIRGVSSPGLVPLPPSALMGLGLLGGLGGFAWTRRRRAPAAI